jgi:lysophospholipase L1-like esterase
MRTLALNLLVLLALLALLVFVPPLAFDFVTAWRARDERAALPIYRGVDWAQLHFDEFSRLSTSYFDFIGWRRKPYAGQTITIDAEGFRRHGAAPREAAEVWIFGGSTVWGPGVRDDMTIPARVQTHLGRKTFNFGEASYTAHQSLNLLSKSLLQGGRPRHVVFYDGANEVVVKCRRELGFFSAYQEATIREQLRAGALASGVFAPTLEVIRRVTRKMGPATEDAEVFDCHRDEAKRRLIAAALLQDWQMAADLAERHGARFTAVLQPHAFIGAPALDHLGAVRTDQQMRSQYEAVYPEIVRQLAAAGVPFEDLTRLADGPEAYYIDFVHLGPAGNDRVAQRIAALLR